jgi:hypothetical protein
VVQRRGPGDESGAVLVDHVAGVERDEQRGPDAERVPAAAESRHAVAGQLVTGEVRRVPLRPVAELHLVVAQAGHPRPVRGRRLVVVAEVPPHRRLGGDVEVGVAQVAVEQVKQGLEGLHGADRVGALTVGQHPLGVRRGQVTETGEPERRPPARRGPERPREGRPRVRIVVRGDRVGVAGPGAQAADLGVVGPHRLAVEAVGVGPRHGRHAPVPVHPRPRVRGRPGRRPGHHHAGRGVITPGQVNLFGGTAAGGRHGRRCRGGEPVRRPAEHAGPGRGQQPCAAGRREHLPTG